MSRGPQTAMTVFIKGAPLGEFVSGTKYILTAHNALTKLGIFEEEVEIRVNK